MQIAALHIKTPDILFCAVITAPATRGRCLTIHMDNICNKLLSSLAFKDAPDLKYMSNMSNLWWTCSQRAVNGMDSEKRSQGFLPKIWKENKIFCAELTKKQEQNNKSVVFLYLFSEKQWRTRSLNSTFATNKKLKTNISPVSQFLSHDYANASVSRHLSKTWIINSSTVDI